MKYRNTVTGAIIETTAQISGGNWVEMDPPKAAPAPAQEKKKSAAKKTK